MKELIILASYCDSEKKLEKLESSINFFRKLEKEVLVFGRYPIPERIQKMCSYWIFDSSDPVIENRSIVYWREFGNFRISHIFPDYGFAAMTAIPKALGFAMNLDYDVAFWFDYYDVDPKNFTEHRDLSLSKMESENVSIIAKKFYPVSNGPDRGISTSSIVFKIKETCDKLKGVIKMDLYKDLIQSVGNDFIAEDFIKKCIEITEIKYHLLGDDSPAMEATMSSTGERTHGNISNPEISKYIETLFVGTNERTGNPCILIGGIKNGLEKIVFDFGNGMTVKEIDKVKSYIIEDLNFFPDKLKVISINDSIFLNDVIDYSFNENYWKLNIVKEKEEEYLDSEYSLKPIEFKPGNPNHIELGFL